MKHIDVGAGYRRLGPEERIQAGDECLNAHGVWIIPEPLKQAYTDGSVVGSLVYTEVYRRRVS